MYGCGNPPFYLLLFCLIPMQTVRADSDQPNIIVILSDDQGWGDLSVHGNSNLHTPNIDRLALFDIASDISERNDLSDQQPQKVTALDKLLQQYLREIDAQMAVPNPQYDPAQPPVSRKAKGNKDKTKKTRKPGTNKRGNP